jgi:hypothetical protein
VLDRFEARLDLLRARLQAEVAAGGEREAERRPAVDEQQAAGAFGAAPG